MNYIEYAWNIKKIETDEQLKEPIYTQYLFIPSLY